MENRTARLTILIDPRKKKLFEDLCARQDLNTSQVVRKLIHQYLMDHLPASETPDWLIAPSSRSAENERPEG